MKKRIILETTNYTRLLWIHSMFFLRDKKSLRLLSTLYIQFYFGTSTLVSLSACLLKDIYFMP